MLNSSPNRKFRWRTFTTFYIVLSFIIISASGIILYVTPPGRVANWSDWRLLGLTKADWQTVHTMFAFIFVLAAVVHIYFNWKVLLSYLRSTVQEGMKHKRELVLSSIAVGTVLVVTLLGLPPASTVMEFGENLSESWVTPKDSPPVPHAELLTIEQFAGKADLLFSDVLRRLNAQGIVPDSPGMTVDALARQHNLTPQELYQKMRSDNSPTHSAVSSGSGYGRKTVAQVAAQLGVPVTAALARLQQKSIAAEEASTLRTLASEHGVSPVELVKIITGEDLD